MKDLVELGPEIAHRYAAFPQVEAVAIAGSRISRMADNSSDIDLYVYSREVLTLEQRRTVAALATRSEIGNAFCEPGDEWIENGAGVDAMFRHLGWIEDQLQRVLVRHEASVGYSTCFWYNVLHSQALFDRKGWFEQLQRTARQPYPAVLKHAIVAKNWPILRANLSSYLHQIELAIARQDQVSVHHRVTALLASYFDILFALNEQPHPGEKRLLRFAEELCAKRPPLLREQVEAVLTACPVSLLQALNDLLDSLEELLKQERLLSS